MKSTQYNYSINTIKNKWFFKREWNEKTKILFKYNKSKKMPIKFEKWPKF